MRRIITRNSFLPLNTYYKINSCYNIKLLSYNNNLFIQQSLFSCFSNNKNIHFKNNNILYFSKFFNSYIHDDIEEDIEEYIDYDIEIDNIKEAISKASNYIISHDFINGNKCFSSCLYSIHKLLKKNITNPSYMQIISALKLQSMIGLGLCYRSLNKYDKAKETYLFALNTIENTPDFDILEYGCYFYQYCELIYKMNTNNSSILINTIKQKITNLSQKELSYYENNRASENELYQLFTYIFTKEYVSSFEQLTLLEDAISFQKVILEFYHSIVGNNINIAYCFRKIALLLEKVKKNEQALEYKFIALEINLSITDNNFDNIASNYNDIGITYTLLHEYEKAIEYFNKAIEVYKLIMGENSNNVAISLNNIGCPLSYLGKYDEALEIHEKSLNILKQNFEEQRPTILRVLNDIGNIYLNLNRYDEALEHYNEALLLYKSLYGDINDQYINYLLNNIGIAEQKLGNLEKALTCFKSVLDSTIILYGENHISTIEAIDAVISTLIKLEKIDEALNYCFKALKITKELYNTNSTEFINVQQFIINILLSQKKYVKALQYQLEIVDIGNNIFKSDSIDMAELYCTTADIYNSLELYELALEYQHKSLDIIQSKYPISNENTIINIWKLCTILYSLKRYDELPKYYEKIFPYIDENHIHYSTLHDNAGIVYGKLEYYEESLKHHLLSLEYYTKKYGINSKAVGILQNNIGFTYFNLKEYKKSFEFLLKSADTLKSIGDTVSLIRTYDNIADQYYNTSYYKEAIEYDLKVIEIKHSLHGENHISTALNYDLIGISYTKLKEYSKALYYKKLALDLYSKESEKYKTPITQIKNDIISLKDIIE